MQKCSELQAGGHMLVCPALAVRVHQLIWYVLLSLLAGDRR